MGQVTVQKFGKFLNILAKTINQFRTQFRRNGRPVGRLAVQEQEFF
jgi:hypothetical protein